MDQTTNTFEPIHTLAKHIRDGHVSPVELVETSLSQIKNHSSLNAFITVLADEARETAKEAEQEIKKGQWRGPLHGVPVAIKDLYDTAGVKTTAAFEHFKDRLPKHDAAGVQKLKQAGAVVVGKTNLHTLAMGTTSIVSYFGAVHNPWNPEYIAGGSSGGSAAAVATGMCYATLDTDAIGSCRLPAACTGTVGFKPSYNLVDNSGILAGEQEPDPAIRWLAHAGITTRSVADTALVLQALTGKQFDVTEDDSLRLGIVTNFEADDEIRRTFNQAVDILRPIYSQKDTLAPFDNPGFDISTIEADRAAISASLFADVDILMLPTTVSTTPRISDVDGNPQALSPQNTLFANYYGLPAISVPAGLDSNGLPVGIQFVGAAGHDETVLKVARHFERLVNFISWAEKG